MFTMTKIEEVPVQGRRAPPPNFHSLLDTIELMGAAIPFARNGEIYGESEPADYVYKVLTGAVRTYKLLSDGRRQIDAFHLPGDIFGLERGDGTQRRRSRWLEFLIGSGRLADEYAHACGRKVSEVMTRNVQAVHEDTPLDEIVQLMERKRIRRVPVLRGKSLVGIVTRANLMRALASFARELRPAAGDDRTIRELLAELRKQPWVPAALIDVQVRNGIVQMWGSISDERQREALHVAAENIAGVKDIDDHLVWVEPNSGMVIEPQHAKAS